MKTSELIKSLSDAYKKLKDSEEKFEVHEVVEPIGSTGFFRFVFAAKKNKKLGLFGAIVSIARNVAYYGARGAVYGIAQEIANRKMQEEMNLEPIDREITGGELALIFARWIETIPKGYIETIGNTIALPKEEKYIYAKVNPKKEIKITIERVSLWGGETPESPGEAQQQGEEAKQMTPRVVSVPMPTPTTMPVPSIDFSTLYVKGSLSSTPNGIAFALRNPYGPATVIAPFKVIIDGESILEDKILLATSSGRIRNTDISPSKPLIVPIGELIQFIVDGIKLSQGQHKIDVLVHSREIGKFIISNFDNLI